MRNLILVKHSLPEINPKLPANRWHLSTEGRHRCQNLAKMLHEYSPKIIISSNEQKAVETAEIISTGLGIDFIIVKNIHEHERANVGILEQKEFQNSIKKLFLNHDKVVFGQESAEQALYRFSRAIKTILSRFCDGNIVIVTHGTVISLFVSHYNNMDPFYFWSKLELPSYVVLSLPGFKIVNA